MRLSVTGVGSAAGEAVSDERMREIVEHGNLPQTSARITFTEGYPAMTPTEGNMALLAILDQASKDLGFGAVLPYDPGRRGAQRDDTGLVQRDRHALLVRCAAVRGLQECADQRASGNAVLDQVVLQVDAALGPLCQEQANRKRIDAVGERVEARLIGRLSGHLVLELLDDGSEVRAMVRPSSNHATLEGLDVELAFGDVRDGEALGAIRQLLYVDADLTFLPGNRGYHAIIAGSTSRSIQLRTSQVRTLSFNTSVSMPSRQARSLRSGSR